MPSDWQQYLYPSTAGSGAGGSGSGAGGSGAVPSLSVGTVQTLPAGASATASITKQGSGYVLNLGVPQGAAGAKGPVGPQGPAGTADASKLKPQDLFKEFRQGYVERPQTMANNVWVTISFDTAFSAVPELYLQPVLGGPRLFSVKDITTTGYSVMCNYSGDLTGWYYTAYVPKD